jgi:hypothetical protein
MFKAADDSYITPRTMGGTTGNTGNANGREHLITMRRSIDGALPAGVAGSLLFGAQPPVLLGLQRP